MTQTKEYGIFFLFDQPGVKLMSKSLHLEQAEAEFEENKQRAIEELAEVKGISPWQAAQKWQEEYDDPIDYHTYNDD